MPLPIKLSTNDLADGLRSERVVQSAADAVHLAEHQMQMAMDAHKRLVAQLRILYDAPEDKYALTDWVQGFVEVTNG